ncbi:MAG: type II toxin-antitoxin system MqsR family toxin [Pseudomonadales bacterium]|jgi:motility quorum-sensing regulator/GCU-specific mRNA interferase toxin|nr:type II toxin-antitoxin system MqsR family toxin [Pseudomonadales bacterium]
MEKYTPHYKLEAIKAVVTALGTEAFTRTAQFGYKRLGLSDTDALLVVLGLARQMFYKSMTTYQDHKVWQDVYHATCPNGRTAYIKLTLRHDAVVIQFKEK